MRNLNFPNILFFIFQLFYVQLHTSAYSLPDQYYINCGSSANTTADTRTFVGDANPISFTLSACRSSTAQNPSSSSSSSTLYGTARIFWRASSYELNMVQSGTYVVRFHFYPFVSQDTNLFDARFNVSASKFTLLSNFTVQNSSNSRSNLPLIEEFILNIDAGKFKINFIPSGPSSFAFVNAIEAFVAPQNFIRDSAPHVTLAGNTSTKYSGLLSNSTLQVIYRINVGGFKVTPHNDTLGRTWVPDDVYLYSRNVTRNIDNNGPPNYQEGQATSFDAPPNVYLTAKELINYIPPNGPNATWRFNVNRNTSFLVRAHFCDVVRLVSSDILKFNLFIYWQVSQVVNPSDISNPNALTVPFYFDFVVDSDDSGFMNISIGPLRDSTNPTAFLNGLEIMELISNPSSRQDGNQACKKHLSVIIGSAIGAVILIIVAVISMVLCWFKFRSRKPTPVETLDWERLNLNRGSSQSRSTERNVTGSPLPPDLNLGLKIAYAEILYATNNFDEGLLIGEGGFGKVYRGILRDGTKVAVKRSEPGRTQGLPEFQTEIMVLSKIRHRHLVSLIGYCDERSEMVLVYEFMEKGALREHLYNAKEASGDAASASRLSWEKRLELCIDAARGLQYLHTGLSAAIIHRDVKSTNILLDENYVAKVADFGISRLDPLDQSHVSTEVKGSFGYLDPEYYRCLILTQKSDVYSFGVVLLEVLCARPAIDNFLPRAQVNLADWGLSCLAKGELQRIVDPWLAGKISPDSLRKFGETVQKCLQDHGSDRPNMVDVLWNLEYALQLQQSAVPWNLDENSNTDVSYNLPLPVVGRLPSYSIAISEDGMEAETRDTDTSVTNDSEVFSQLKMPPQSR